MQPRKSRRSSGAITLGDIAAMAGVAPITVSRALNQPDQVSAEVLRRVREAVDRTGYVPNRMAGGLASARSRIIAAIVPSAVSAVFMETIDTLTASLFDSGYQLMLGQTGYSLEREEMLIESFIGRRPDGIFLTGVLGPGKGRTRLVASGIPVIEAWDLTPSPVDMVIGFSHPDIGRSVASYLLRKGRRKPAVIDANDPRAARRRTAFQQELAAAGIHHVPVVNSGSNRTLAEGRKALAQVLALQPDTDAVFCSSDLLALGVLTEARHRGLTVPDALSVIGFGDIPSVADMLPSLTTVRVNGGRIGALAAEYLVRRTRGEAVEPRIVDLGFTIVERESA